MKKEFERGAKWSIDCWAHVIFSLAGFNCIEKMNQAFVCDWSELFEPVSFFNQYK